MEILARGRRKLFGERITLPLADDMLQAVDASLGKGEARLSFVREAIQRELSRRAEMQARYYLRATLSEVINDKVFFTTQLRSRDVVVFDASGYRNSASEAIDAILDQGAEFSIDVIVIVGTMPQAINPRESGDNAPYEAGRTYIRGEDGYMPLNEFPINSESFSSAVTAMDLAKRMRTTNTSSHISKTPNEETRAAMEEARAIRAAKTAI